MLINIIDALGGARQISSVIALVKSQTRAQELLNEALNGSGAAMDAQETWSQSLEAKMQDLTSAISIFWQTFTSSEAVSDFVTGTTQVVDSLTKMVETIGSIPTALTIAGNGLMLFNKNFRQLGLIGVQTVIPSLGNFSKSLSQQRLQLEENRFELEQNIATQKAKIASTQKLIDQGKVQTKEGKNLKRVLAGHRNELKKNTRDLDQNTTALQQNTLKTVALNAAMSIGLMAAFSIVTTAIGKFINNIKNAKEQVKEFNESIVEFNQNKDEIELEAKKIKQFYKLSKELKTLSENSKEYAEKQAEINELVSELETADGRYLQILKDENKQLEEQYNLLNYVNSARVSENASEEGKKLVSSNLVLSFKEYEAKNTYDDYMLAQSGYLRAIEMKEKAEEEAYQKALANNQTLAEAEQARFEAGLAYEDNINSRREYLDDLEEILRQTILFFENHNNMIDEIEASGGETKARRLELPESLKKIKTELFNATSATKNNTNALEDNAEAAETAAEKQARLAQEARENLDSFIDYTKTLADLTKLLEDIETNGITLDNFDNEALADFTGDLTNAAEVQEYLRQKILETERSQLLAYEQMKANDEAFYQTQVKNSDAYNAYKQNLDNAILKFTTELKNKGLKAEAEALNKKLQMAKDDLDNAETLAIARAKIEEGLIQGMQKGWSEYYQMNRKDMRENLDFYYANKEEMDKKNPGYEKLAKEMEAYLASYNTLIEITKDPITIKPPTISSVSSSSSTSSSSSSSSEVGDLDLEIDRYHDLERAITRVNNALKKNEITQENAKPTQKVKLMKEEIQLYQELQEAQKALYTEQKKETAELKKKLANNGFTFNTDGSLKNYGSQLAKLEKSANKLSSDAKKAKIEEVKAIKELADAYEKLVNETLPNTQAEYKDLTNTIKELEKAQLEYIADIQSKITDALTDELEKRTDAVKKELQKQRDLYNEEYEQEQWEDQFNEEQNKLNEIMQSINNLSRDTSEAGKLKLEQLYQELADQQKVLDDLLNEKAKEDGDKAFDKAEEALDEALENALDPKNLAEMVNQALTNGFIKLDGEILKTDNLLTQMLENSGEAFLATGQLLKTELIDGLKVAQKLMSDLSTTSRSLGISSLSDETLSIYGATPAFSRSIQTEPSSMTQSISVSFESLLNVQGNLDSTLMLDLDTKLRQAMDQVTATIAGALSYR